MTVRRNRAYLSPEQLLEETARIAPTEYEGYRTTKQGQKVWSNNLAQRALGRFLLDSPLPIYNEPYSKYLGKPISPDFIDSDGNFSKTVLTEHGLHIDSELTERDLILVITVPKVPHAMIYIIREDGKYYTLGFGFQDENDQQGIIKDRIRALASKIPKYDNILESWAHTFEVLRAGIYTPDYLTPNTDQESRIVWIDFLKKTAINNLKKDLKHVIAIVFGGKVEGGKSIVTQSSLIIDPKYKKYNEASSIFPSATTTNCIKWVKNILGVNFDCGWLNNPANCKSVTSEELENIKDSYLNNKELAQTIHSIQRRLRTNLCKQVGNSLGFCGGRSKNKKLKKLKTRKYRN